MAKNLNDILKRYSDALSGKRSSTVNALTTGDNPGIDYADKMKDGRYFITQHSVEKFDDRVGNGDDVYNASNIKRANMERHGHVPKPKDIKAYKKNQQVGQPENKLKEESEQLDEVKWNYTDVNPKMVKSVLAAHRATGNAARHMGGGRIAHTGKLFKPDNGASSVNESKDDREYGYEGEMAMSQIKSIMNHSEQLMKMLKPDTDMPEWVQSKITLASDYIQTAADYFATEMSEAKMCESCGKTPCGCDATEPRYNGKDKSGKRKLLTDKKIQEMAKSENQAIAARIALMHKKKGTKPPEGTASASMMGMNKKQLKDYTKAEPGAPKKVEEAMHHSTRQPSADIARNKMTDAINKRKTEKMKMEQSAPAETPITMPSGAIGDTGRV